MADSRITLVCSPDLVDDAGVRQLHATLERHPDIVRVVAMPDLHGGPGTPIGACFEAPVVYPRLVGGDIGCGMSLFRLHGKARRWSPDKLAKRLEGLQLDALPNASDLLRANGLEPTRYDADLGTLGGGNHFAELLAIDDVFQPDQLAGLAGGACDAEALLLLVHTGSRRVGLDVLRTAEAIPEAGPECRLADPATQRTYLRAHDAAVAWALANRMMVAHRVGAALGMQPVKLLNIVHNYLEVNARGGEMCFLHRKGVGRVPPGAVTVIPGSRGAPSYLVRFTPDADLAEAHLCSIAHGAGRKWTRSKAEAMTLQTAQQLRRTPLGSRVVCDDVALLRQEAPQAYKDIDSVIADLQAAGLITLVARLLPLCTYKQ